MASFQFWLKGTFLSRRDERKEKRQPKLPQIGGKEWNFAEKLEGVLSFLCD